MTAEEAIVLATAKQIHEARRQEGWGQSDSEWKELCSGHFETYQELGIRRYIARFSEFVKRAQKNV